MQALPETADATVVVTATGAKAKVGAGAETETETETETATETGTETGARTVTETENDDPIRASTIPTKDGVVRELEIGMKARSEVLKLWTRDIHAVTTPIAKDEIETTKATDGIVVQVAVAVVAAIAARGLVQNIVRQDTLKCNGRRLLCMTVLAVYDRLSTICWPFILGQPQRQDKRMI